MKLTYDPIHNIGDIRFREKTSRVGTIRVSNELSIDLALRDRSMALNS